MGTLETRQSTMRPVLVDASRIPAEASCRPEASSRAGSCSFPAAHSPGLKSCMQWPLEPGGAAACTCSADAPPVPN